MLKIILEIRLLFISDKNLKVGERVRFSNIKKDGKRMNENI